jgi:malic enzyme
MEPARRLLDRWRPEIPCFNDDVQGTGCVTLAAILAGMHVTKQKLGDLRMVVFGGGTAGVGIADQVRDAIATERGISKEEAAKQIWYVETLLQCGSQSADIGPGSSTSPGSSLTKSTGSPTPRKPTRGQRTGATRRQTCWE